VLDEVESMAQEDDVDPQARTRAARALLLARKGRHDEALVLAREAVKLFEATDYLDSYATMLTTLAAVLLAAGRAGEARTGVGGGPGSL
jgi:tetratricopeptide (TPR) repeat protein